MIQQRVGRSIQNEANSVGRNPEQLFAALPRSSGASRTHQPHTTPSNGRAIIVSAIDLSTT